MKPDGVGAGLVRFLGWLLMAAGVLIAATAGACSMVFLVAMLGSTSAYPSEIPNMLMLVLAFGGIPIAVGAGLFFGGRWLARSVDIRRLPPRRIDPEGDDAL